MKHPGSQCSPFTRIKDITSIFDFLSNVFELDDILNLCQNEDNSGLVKDLGHFCSIWKKNTPTG